ncbi:uncharacterized protein C8Q71DRAFT_723211 [Rhodofomes roseus]|uniref:Zn(2)-C6 fungal-type domain-containing protein n=1 Tax=Rhodofomes roseus TaxID=34475 RepID=A0ABQ8KKF0_9APHY|nr:uncharacterized protein C8Q71DRAFT_723211 [Rhodofomes roseus]KAH9837968.1 hypothetical protein C8Q71DRAFT_723211 [Rhodofomes roseus]
MEVYVGVRCNHDGRRKKIRCDGVRPTCYQCEKAGVHDDCIYGAESQFHGAQLLEDKISQLKARIVQLEGNRSGPVLLHDPYAPFHEAQQEQTARSRDRQEVSMETIRALMQSFSGTATQTGFFLHAPRFCQRVYAQPTSSLPTHVPALLNAVYLLGAHTSTNTPMKTLQANFLASALEDLSATGEPEPGRHPGRLADGDSAQGVYHMDAASAMILASRLHEVEGVRQSLPIDARLSRYQLPPPADQTEQDERVNAYWAALVLDKCWSPILGRMPILTNIGLEAGSADAGQLLNVSETLS